MIEILTPDKFDDLKFDIHCESSKDYDILNKMCLVYRKLYEDTKNFRSGCIDVEQYYKDNESDE